MNLQCIPRFSVKESNKIVVETEKMDPKNRHVWEKMEKWIQELDFFGKIWIFLEKKFGFFLSFLFYSFGNVEIQKVGMETNPSVDLVKKKVRGERKAPKHYVQAVLYPDNKRLF